MSTTRWDAALMLRSSTPTPVREPHSSCGCALSTRFDLCDLLLLSGCSLSNMERSLGHPASVQQPDCHLLPARCALRAQALAVRLNAGSTDWQARLRRCAQFASRLCSHTPSHTDILTPALWVVNCFQMKTITRRRNTRNGRIYAADPTIFAWSICSECQCVPMTHHSKL